MVLTLAAGLLSLGASAQLLSLSADDGRITAAWSSVRGATSYELRHRITGDPWPASPLVRTSRSATLANLENSRVYEFQVRACTPTCAAWSGRPVETTIPMSSDLVLSDRRIEVDENGRVERYTVALEERPARAVDVYPEPDQATVVTTPRRLTFTTRNWDLPQTVTVEALEDDADEDRTVFIEHSLEAIYSARSQYFSLSRDFVRVTVRNLNRAEVLLSRLSLALSEAPGRDTETYAVVLGARPTETVTITVTSSNEQVATASPRTLTFTTGNWSRAQRVTVRAVDDDVDNARSRTATISHAVQGGNYHGIAVDSVSVTVADDDSRALRLSRTGVSVNESGAGRTATYTVALATEPTGTVRVTPSSADADSVRVSGTLTFTTRNWDAPQTVTLTAVDDDVDNGDRTVVISHRATGGDYGRVGADVTVTLRDDDMRGLVLSQSRLAVPEGGSGSFSVALASRPTGTVTVSVSSDNPSSATVAPATLSFLEERWNTPQDVTVRGVDDAVDNAADRTATVAARAQGGDYGGAGASLRVSVTDDDMAGAEVAPASLAVLEGESASYTVALLSQPTGEVTVRPVASDTARLEVGAPLVFTTRNWREPQTVTVTSVADADDLDDTLTVTHAASGGGYDAVAFDAVRVAVSDERQRETRTLRVQATVLRAATASAVDAVADRFGDDDMRFAKANTWTHALATGLGALKARRGAHAWPAGPGYDSQAFGFDQAFAADSAYGPLGQGPSSGRGRFGGVGGARPPGGASGAMATGFGQTTFWGAADYQELAVEESDATDWDGTAASVHVGIDRRFDGGLAAGIAASWFASDFDYASTSAGGGLQRSFDTSMTSLHPYVGISAEGGGSLWGMVGYGEGEVDIVDAAGNSSESRDLEQRMGAVGGSFRLYADSSEATRVNLKADAWTAQLGVYDASDAKTEVEAWRYRLAVETRHSFSVGVCQTLVPSLTLAARNDGGDGVTGSGAEVDIGLDYSNGNSGFAIKTRARRLLAYDADEDQGELDEWGLSGAILLSPGLGGSGPLFTLTQAYGAPQNDVERLWEHGAYGADYRMPSARLKTRFGYGLRRPGGLLTPYTGANRYGDAHSYRIGARWESGPATAFDIAGERRDGPAGALGYGLLVQLTWSPAQLSGSAQPRPESGCAVR